MDIAPYAFDDAERLRFGRYPVLDTILYRWARRIEETLFEQAGVEVYAGASVFEEMRFSAFYATLRRPRPIYFFAMEPLQGTGLFVVDNRFSAFCLRRSAGGSGREVKLTPSNQARLQRIVQSLLSDFAQCWRDVAPMTARLRKITTYPFRARILNSHEKCLVAQIHLAGHNISARLTWCLPRSMLEPVAEPLRESRVIPPVQMGAEGAERPSADTVLRWLDYGVQLRMGQLSVADAAERLAVGAVVPLRVEPNHRAVVEVEGRPVLQASVGEVEGRFAFKVEGAYVPPGRGTLADPAAFRPVHWPEAPAER